MTLNTSIPPMRGKGEPGVGYAKYTTATGLSGIQKDEALTLNGKVLALHIVAPDLVTDTTFDVSLLNADGVVLWTKTGNSDNGTRKFERGDANMLYAIPLAGACTLRYDFTTAQAGGSLDFVAHLYYE